MLNIWWQEVTDYESETLEISNKQCLQINNVKGDWLTLCVCSCEVDIDSNISII